MTRIAQTTAFHALTDGQSRRPSLISRLRRFFGETETAMAAQARLTAITDETQRDTWLSPEDLTGAASYDPALPFFLQSGFGRGDR